MAGLRRQTEKRTFQVFCLGDREKDGMVSSLGAVSDKPELPAGSFSRIPEHVEKDCFFYVIRTRGSGEDTIFFKEIHGKGIYFAIAF